MNLKVQCNVTCQFVLMEDTKMTKYLFLIWYKAGDNQSIQFHQKEMPLATEDIAKWACDNYADVNSGYCEMVVDGTVVYKAGTPL